MPSSFWQLLILESKHSFNLRNRCFVSVSLHNPASNPSTTQQQTHLQKQLIHLKLNSAVSRLAKKKNTTLPVSFVSVRGRAPPYDVAEPCAGSTLAAERRIVPTGGIGGWNSKVERRESASRGGSVLFFGSVLIVMDVDSRWVRKLGFECFWWTYESMGVIVITTCLINGGSIGVS